MISTDDLAAMQATVTGGLNTPCTISRPTDTNGPLGQTRVWNVVSSPMCRVGPYRRLDMEAFAQATDRLELANRWIIILPHDTDVAPTDRITALGIVYEVSSVSGPRTNQIDLTVLCYKVQ